MLTCQRNSKNMGYFKYLVVGNLNKITEKQGVPQILIGSKSYSPKLCFSLLLESLKDVFFFPFVLDSTMMSLHNRAAVVQQGAVCVYYLSKAGALASKPRDSLTRWEPTFRYGGSRQRGISPNVNKEDDRTVKKE